MKKKQQNEEKSKSKPIIEVKVKFHKNRFKKLVKHSLEKFEDQFEEFAKHIKESLNKRVIEINFSKLNVNKKVSVIIPAYNEEERVLNVVKPALKSQYVGEVIVVDDGSKDRTYEVLKEFKESNKKLTEKLIIIKQKNKGKAGAMKTGVDKSHFDYVLFLDADLVGLRTKDIDKLILPVVLGYVDITLSLRKNSLEIFKMLKCDFVSGERCMHKSLLNDLWNKVKSGFGIEVVMNQKIIKEHLKYASIEISAKNTVKTKKRGFINGIKGEWEMLQEIFHNVNSFLVLQQLLVMSSNQYKIIFKK
ncbi:MAG: glycosyltransferase family 2 protein [Candidatus Woesearchaeota archaeon]